MENEHFLKKFMREVRLLRKELEAFNKTKSNLVVKSDMIELERNIKKMLDNTQVQLNKNIKKNNK